MILYFVRHGETNGNLGGQYNLTSWGTLTERGFQQAEELAVRLTDIAFDEIIVSPLERAVLTVLPYLKRNNRKAQAWPEFCEMGGRKDVVQELPKEIRYGPPLQLPDVARGYVELDPAVPGCLPPDRETYIEGQRRAEMAANRIVERYGGREITVLMVAHACNGARVLESLLRIEMLGRFQHDNCGITLMRQKQNGEFIMLCMNCVTNPPKVRLPQPPVPPKPAEECTPS